MVRKRKKVEVVKPWCFYCDREFNQEADLLTHQKSKHFKCPNCTKRLGSARALSIHCLQVHKTGIQEIPEAKEGRKDPKWEIVGSVGIPPGMVRGGPCPPRVGGPLPSSQIGATGPTAAVRPRLAYPPYPSGVMMPPPVYGGVPPPMGAPPPPYYGAPSLHPPPPSSSSLHGRPHVPPPPGGGVGHPPRPPPPATMPSSSSSSQQQRQQPTQSARPHQYVSAPAHIHRKPTRTKQDDDTVPAP